MDADKGGRKAWKALCLTLGIVGSVTFATASSAATWRSNSGKTVIPNLNSICWGNSYLPSVRTVFGGGPYSGDARFNNIKNQGCVPGDTLTGFFNVYQNQNHCQGRLTVTWQGNDRAHLQWQITNLGSCSVGNANWEITTYPVATSGNGQSPTSSQGVARVFDPPSNVRETPNGRIICSVRQVTMIDLYGSPSNGWYQTDVCGPMGYIHHSQIEF
ncbi:hypothetical protein [Euhalothece natronophila]|uniref:hypothetical protein n=1 Tax=Euhalothece natronophila TaxID=577489 RepID=UPI001FE954F7|nr:hypothetical protein [Euhalothece natronophila]